jgi:hypothetical protein
MSARMDKNIYKQGPIKPSWKTLKNYTEPAKLEKDQLVLCKMYLGPFRDLICNLSKIIYETLRFKFDNSSISLCVLDETHSILVGLKLDSFISYNIKEPTEIGLDLSKLKTLMRGHAYDSIITITYYNYITILIEENGMRNEIKLDTTEFDKTDIDIPSLKIKTKMCMPTKELESVYRRIPDRKKPETNIKLSNFNLIFDTIAIIPEKIEGKAFDNYYSLSKIKQCLLFSNLSDNVIIKLNDTDVMILEYSIAKMGSIRICHAPMKFD